MSWPAVAALAMGDADIVMMRSETGKYIHQLSGQKISTALVGIRTLEKMYNAMQCNAMLRKTHALNNQFGHLFDCHFTFVI